MRIPGYMKELYKHYDAIIKTSTDTALVNAQQNLDAKITKCRGHIAYITESGADDPKGKKMLDVRQSLKKNLLLMQKKDLESMSIYISA